MFDLKSIPRLMLLSAIVTLAPSCGHPPRPFSVAPANTTTNDSLSSAKAYYSSGNYKKSLEIYTAAVDRHPGKQDLLDAYAGALEDIKEKADKAYEAQDYARAGELYHMLLRSGFGDRPLQGRISFDADDCAMRVGACSKMLIEQGIMKYRAGDLHEAVAIWKSILVFNPTDREARMAIDRANAQLQNLKHIQ
jgi:tetratricopeptide (TPR) repeat protein